MVEYWIGPYSSGEEIIIPHTWEKQGSFVIEAKAKDVYGDESDWGYLEINIPRVKTSFMNRILEKFPNLFLIMRHILGQ